MNHRRTTPPFCLLAAGSLLSAAAFAPQTSAAVIANDVLLIDLGKTGQESGGLVAASDGNFWNDFALDTNATVDAFPTTLVADLVRASDNTATGASLMLTGSTLNSVGIGGADNTGADDTNLFPESAARDTFFLSAGNNTQLATFEFRDLDPTLTYDLSLFGSVPSGSRPLTILTAGGATASYQPVDNGETATSTADLTGLTTDALGTLVFTVGVDAGGSGHINTIALTAVPEPASLSLLALGGLLIVHRRRRA